jgi:hypothetical protein
MGYSVKLISHVFENTSPNEEHVFIGQLLPEKIFPK